MRKNCGNCKFSENASTSKECAPCVGEVFLPNWVQKGSTELLARKIDPSRRCGNCQHFDLPGDHEPCKSCGGLIALPNWKRKQGEDNGTKLF